MVDAAIIKKTQECLGKVIKKPPLTEKLLSKPPFRYLHDIISEVTKNTGYLEGLFADDEKSSANVKEKEHKLAYLQKAIDAVGLSVGSQLAVRANKVIAGQEAEKTNEFLQHLGKAAAKGPDNEVVKRVKKGEKPGKKSDAAKGGSEGKSKRSKEEERKPKSSKERESSKTSGKREQSSSKERSSARSGDSKERREKAEKRGRREKSSKREEKAEGDEKREARQKKERDDQREIEKKEKEEQKEKERKEKEEKREKEERREREEKREREERREKEEQREKEEKSKSGQEEKTEADGPHQKDESLSNGFHAEEDAVPARIPRPSSAKGARRRPDPSEPGEHKPTYAEAVAGATTGEPAIPITAGVRRERPTSARPAPPKIRKKEEEKQSEAVVRNEPPAGIITDAPTTEDAEEMYVHEGADAPVRQPVIMGSGGGGGTHGGLVQKIIDSQKNYAEEKQVEDKGPIMNQAARQKQRALVQKEIDQLRGGIQLLASSAAPLGKVLDYLQEDLDSMQKELETWRSENKYHDTAIKAEQSHMEKTLEPLRDQLEETDREILNMISRINATKCNIHTNDLRIEKMLSTMSFG